MFWHAVVVDVVFITVCKTEFLEGALDIDLIGKDGVARPEHYLRLGLISCQNERHVCVLVNSIAVEFTFYWFAVRCWLEQFKCA